MPPTGNFTGPTFSTPKAFCGSCSRIPSPNAEPFKLWLAQVGNDRLNEIADPEKARLRGADFYRAKGYTEGWINQRLQTIEMRQELTDEWRERGLATEKEYAILTNEITKAWRGMTVGAYRLRIGSRKSHLRKYTTARVLIKQILKPIRNEYIFAEELAVPTTLSKFIFIVTSIV
ncbi:hypothetical protein AGMMS49959_11280 [Planctomycetales bacterium]|nr:hypothetical protein AGMMS49959_11280 [Planctomycetales bacterium]